VEACIAVVWDQAEAAARRVIETIPDGEYERKASSTMTGAISASACACTAKVIVSGSTMTVDFSGMNPQVPSPLNSGRSGGLAAARIAFKSLTSPDVDVNEAASVHST
jgi:N-methylhydantoinase B